jgi:hypothetical protein
MDHQKQLTELKPAHEFFVGIDSDGCVFDTMEIKQKEFFIPAALKYFDLFPIAKPLRETWEFVNLYSVNRGVNRFPALIKVFELLAERKEVRESGCSLPDLSLLKEWIKSETKLSNATLGKFIEGKADNGLLKVYEWSETVNREIGEWLQGVPPFRWARQTISRISDSADAIVVSQTPLEALLREWKEHGMDDHVRLIAGQEHGTKAEHIALSAKGKYPDDMIILIGDAPGDLEAAKRNNVLFYPIVPGAESISWERLYTEAFDRFLSGTYKGGYEASVIAEFSRSLPDTPPWYGRR